MNFMKIAISEAEKCTKIKEVPVGAVLVKNGKIISKSHNDRTKKHFTTSHAEINVIRKANKKLKDWRLNGCDLYVTLEPCSMCSEVIKEARIDSVYYLLENNDKNIKHMFTIFDDTLLKNEYKEKFQSFFKENCKR